MSTGGLSKARLGHVHDVMFEHGEVPGIVTLVSWRGEVHVGLRRDYGTASPFDLYRRPSPDVKGILVTAFALTCAPCNYRMRNAFWPPRASLRCSCPSRSESTSAAPSPTFSS